MFHRKDHSQAADAGWGVRYACRLFHMLYTFSSVGNDKIRASGPEVPQMGKKALSAWKEKSPAAAYG